MTATGEGGSRRRRALRRIAVVIGVVLLGLLVVWFVPSGSHGASRALTSDQTQQEMAALGTVKVLRRSPEGEMQGYRSSGISVKLDGGGQVVISAFEYKSQAQALVRSWLMSPERNGAAWDSSGRWAPEPEDSWDLPNDSTLVGLDCHDGGCDRWLLWWPRGADILVLDLRSVTWSGPGVAVERMRPVWDRLR